MSEQNKEMQDTIIKWLNPILTAVVAFFLTQLHIEFKEVKTDIEKLNRSIITIEVSMKIEKEIKNSDKASIDAFHSQLSADVNAVKEKLHNLDIDLSKNVRNR